MHGQSDLPEIAETGNLIRLSFPARNCREQKGCENGNDRNGDEQLNQRKRRARLAHMPWPERISP
jgi:hypothetical protein